MIGEQRLAAGTIVWGAGVMASAAAHWLGVDKDRVGRVMVGADLSLPGHPEIFCIGDTACALDAAASPCPASRRSPSSRAPMWRACCAP